MTAEMRQKAALTLDDEYRLTACAELALLGLPSEVAGALAFSGAIGSASELSALDQGDLERLLAEEPIKRLLPAEFRIDPARIEGWLARITPLTADEDAAGRSSVSEAEAASAAREEDAAVVAEDWTLGVDQVGSLLDSLRLAWSRAEGSIEALARDKTRPVGGLPFDATLVALQREIGSLLEAARASVSGGFVAIDEASSLGASEEDVDAAGEVLRLQGEVVRLQASMERLRIVAARGTEADSAAAATETGPSDRETSPRGE